jgi:hypothetical protein
MQPYPVVAADAFVEVDNFSKQTFPVSRNFVTSRCIVVLVGTSFSGYVLLNASRTGANDFSAN